MTEGAEAVVPEEAWRSAARPLLLAMAMFVLVVDTSLMNVSISAVVRTSAQPSAASSRRSRRGAGVCRLHPDREQGRGSLRAQAGIHLGLATPSAPWR